MTIQPLLKINNQAGIPPTAAAERILANPINF